MKKCACWSEFDCENLTFHFLNSKVRLWLFVLESGNFPKIFWDCALPYKSRCQNWTQAHLYSRQYDDRHSFGVSVSKQNVKFWKYNSSGTQGFQSDQDRKENSKCQHMEYSESCPKQTVCVWWPGKGGWQTDPGSLYYLVVNLLPLGWVFWGQYFHFDILLEHFMAQNFMEET